ncbi:MAG: hypothetical protein ACR2KC_08315 [Acidimicrobiales bacterium]
MDEARWLRVVRAMAAAEDQGAARLCAASARTLGVSGAGIVLLTGKEATASPCALRIRWR